jgi:hypothetical protein
LIPKPNKSKPFSTALFVAAALVVLGLLTQISPAGLNSVETITRVEIDGVQYGVFDTIEGLPKPETINDAPRHVDGGLRIKFMRDFVTDPSLYLWAKNVTHSRSDQKDINVTIYNKDGDEVVRYSLRQCQPLSWTVEAANPALGGFHESIEIAVQDIEME